MKVGEVDSLKREVRSPRLFIRYDMHGNARMNWASCALRGDGCAGARRGMWAVEAVARVMTPSPVRYFVRIFRTGTVGLSRHTGPEGKR